MSRDAFIGELRHRMAGLPQEAVERTVVGLNVVATTFFQSIGRPKTAIVLSTLRQGACLLPTAWFLPYFIEDHAFGVWLSMPVSRR